jgi:hypothetical protein
MLRSKWMGLSAVVLSATVMLTPALAQDATPEATGEGTEGAPAMQLPPIPEDALATGLNGPRGLSFGPDGTLYIATAGVGGETQVDTPEGPGSMGMTSEIIAISPDGKQSTVISGLPSGGDVGVQGVYATEDGLLAVTGAIMVPNVPLIGAGLWLDKSGHITNVVDLYGYEVANNPAAGEEINTDPADVAVAEDSTVYFVDAGGNDVLKWTEDAGLTTFAAWPDNPVPTSISIGPDGNIAIGFLSAAPFAPGTAKVETYSPDGKLLQTYGGLSMVSGVLWNEDGIYAVELSQDASSQDAPPAPGAVVKVGEDGNNTVVVDNLMFPYGIAQSPDGQVVVSIHSTFLPPGSGAVIPVTLK